ncbi:MAG: c-type cytochrome [Pseudomonadota bacterium]
MPLLLCLAALPFMVMNPVQASELTGEQLFVSCAGCHSIEAGAPHGVGPNLHGLAGKPVASAEGFAYSPALQEADFSWDAGALTAWIVRTEAMVPGTWMLYHNHLEAEEVNRLVNWLLTPDAAAD